MQRQPECLLVLVAVASLALFAVPTGMAATWNDGSTSTGTYDYVAVDEVEGAGFYDWSGGGTALAINTFGGYATRAFPAEFEFDFYDQVYTEADDAHMGEDGLLGMGTGWAGRADTALDGPYNIPSGNDPDDFIAPFWFPQYYTCPTTVVGLTATYNGQGVYGGGDALTDDTVNSEGDRMAVYTWDEWATSTGTNQACTDAHTYQIQLYNGSDIMEFHYQFADTWIKQDELCMRHVVGIEGTSADALVVSEDLDLNCAPRFVVEDYAVRLWKNNATDAWDASYVVDGDTMLNPIRLPTSDDPLLFKEVTKPLHGVLASTPEDLTRYHVETLAYTPDAGFSGTDHVNLTVTDGYDAAAQATATIHVNAAPEAQNDTFVMDAVSSGPSNVWHDPLHNDADAFWSASSGATPDPHLTIKDVGSPVDNAGKEAGSVLVAPDGGSFSYTPPSDFHGNVTFPYNVTDGRLHDQGWITLHVNAPPRVEDTEVAVNPGKVITVQTGVTDAFWSVSSGAVVDPELTGSFGPSGPTNGSVEWAAELGVRYTADEDASGTDTFELTFTDGRLKASSNVTVHIVGPPEAVKDTLVVDQDGTVLADLLANDIGAGYAPLMLTEAGPADRGSVELEEGLVRYTPPAGEVGTDAFAYTTSDGVGTTQGTATVYINEVPRAVEDTFTVEVGQTALLTVLENDEDGYFSGWQTIETTTPDLRITSVQGGTGALSHTDHGIYYTPTTFQPYTDTFTYTVSDGHATSTATVDVDVHSDAEVVTEPVTVLEGGKVVITGAQLAISAPGNEPPDWTYTSVTPPLHGELRMDGEAVDTFTQHDIDSAAVVYHHDGSEASSDTLHLEVGNGTITLPLTLPVHVDPVDDPPVLSGDFVSLGPGTTITVPAHMLGVTDPDTAPADIILRPQAPTLGNFLLDDQPVAAFTAQELVTGAVRMQALMEGKESLFIEVDDGSTAVPGVFDLWVVPANTGPERLVGATLPVRWGESVLVDPTQLAYVDDHDGPEGVRFSLIHPPAHGDLLFQSIPMREGDTFTQADIDAGRLVYRHLGTGQDHDAFRFQVRDTTPVWPGIMVVEGALHIDVDMVHAPDPLPRYTSTGPAMTAPVFHIPYQIVSQENAVEQEQPEFFLEEEDADYDLDDDGRVDHDDNCPSVPNVTQDDLDGDKVGDACDPDMDGDGFDQRADNCPRIANEDQDDSDFDGVGDACDDVHTTDQSRSCADCNPRTIAAHNAKQPPVEEGPGWPVFGAGIALLVVLAAMALLMGRLLRPHK